MMKILALTLCLLAVTAIANDFAHSTRQRSLVTKGLVSYWSMRNSGTTVHDEIGSNDGTAVGGVSFAYGNGVVGQGSDFDGSDDYVEVSDDDSLDIQVTDGITFSAWINPNGLTTNDSFDTTNPKYLLMKAEGIDNVNYWVRLVGQKLDIGWRDSADISYNVKRMDNHNVNNNEWQHIVGVHNTTDVIFYINNIEQPSTVANGDMSDPSTSNTEKLFMGADGYSEQRFFNGSIDEVRIYNRALTESEIWKLYVTAKKIFRNR